MAVTLTIAGSSYSYPSNGDARGTWGTNATTAMQAVADNAIWKDGSVALTANWDIGAYTITGTQFISDIAIGTPPLVVTSTTVVPNLNVDQVDGLDSTDLVLVDGSQSLTANWDAGSFKITAQQLESDVVTGTAPLVVASTTAVTNLNADTVDGKDATDLVLVDGSQELTANWDTGNFEILPGALTARSGNSIVMQDNSKAAYVAVLNNLNIDLNTAGIINIGSASSTAISGDVTMDSSLTSTDSASFTTVTGTTELISPIVRATGAGGLRIEDDGDNLGIFVEDGGQVGIGTATPITTLDVEGTVSYKSEALATGTHNGFSVASSTIIRCTSAAGNVTINDLAGGVEGQVIYIMHEFTGNTLQLTNLSGSNQQIITQTGGNYTTTTFAVITLICTGSFWYSNV